MKKIICLIVIFGIIFIFGTPALAGDIPEGIFEDKALLFFGEVVSYNETDKTITVLPTQKIKGDVKINAVQSYEYGYPIGVYESGYFPVDGEIFLMSYYDEYNPLYVFRITSTDTKTLEIEGITGDSMWAIIQTYLNEGVYEQKESERLTQEEERLTRLNESTPSPEPTPTPETAPARAPLPVASQEPADTSAKSIADYWPFGLLGIAIIGGVVLYLIRRK